MNTSSEVKMVDYNIHTPPRLQPKARNMVAKMEWLTKELDFF